MPDSAAALHSAAGLRIWHRMRVRDFFWEIVEKRPPFYTFFLTYLAEPEALLRPLHALGPFTCASPTRRPLIMRQHHRALYSSLAAACRRSTRPLGLCQPGGSYLQVERLVPVMAIAVIGVGAVTALAIGVGAVTVVTVVVNVVRVMRHAQIVPAVVSDAVVALVAEEHVLYVVALVLRVRDPMGRSKGDSREIQ